MNATATDAQDDHGDDDQGGSAPRATEAQERARLVVGIVGMLFVVAFVAACWQVDRARGTSPAYVRVTSIAHHAHGGAEVYTATVENTGDVTAEQVLVRGEVAGEDPVDHEIDFLAPGEADEVSFRAPGGTKRGDVHVRVHAWTASH
jgi:uncharacterized protein (TIGR02588 family)